MEQSMKRNNLLAADEVRTFPLLDMPNAPDARILVFLFIALKNTKG